MELPCTIIANGNFGGFALIATAVLLLSLLLAACFRSFRYIRKYNILRESSSALLDHLAEVEELCRTMAQLGKINSFISSAEQRSAYSDDVILSALSNCGIEINKLSPADRERYLEQCRKLFSGEITQFSENCLLQTRPQRRFVIAAQSFTLPETGLRKVLFASMDASELEQQNKELANADLILKAIFDNLPGHIFIKNISDDFSYVRCNPVYSQLIQKNPVDLIGKTDFDLFERPLAQAIRACDMQIANSGNTADNRWLFTTPDGKDHAIRFISRRLLQADNSEWLLGFGVDVTRQEHIAGKLRRRNKELRLLLAQVPDKRFLLDNQLHLTCTTPAIHQYLVDCQPGNESQQLCCSDFCRCGITDAANCPAQIALQTHQEQICNATCYAGKQLQIKPLLNESGTVNYLAVQLENTVDESDGSRKEEF